MEHVDRTRLLALLGPLIQLLQDLETKFQRTRVWGEIQATLGVLLWMQPLVRTSLKSACESFFELFGSQFPLGKDAPDPGGLQRAIHKLPLSTLEHLQGSLSDQARAKPKRKLPVWLRGVDRAILATDGTTFSTTRTPALLREFPVIRDRTGKDLSPHPLTRLVVAWDVVSHSPVTWWLSSIRTGERLSFRSMLCKVSRPSLFLFDRGFPSREAFADLIGRSHWFVCRMVTGEAGAWPEVAAFLKSGQRSAWVDFTIGKGRSTRIIRLRLVRRVFNRGRPGKYQKRECMVVVTHVPTTRLDDRSVVRLYHRRWGVETGFREMKCFSATKDRWRSACKQGIERELLAVMIWYTLTAMITGPLTRWRGMEADENGWRANTCVVLRAALVLLRVLASPTTCEYLLLELEERLRRVMRWRQRRRPNRSEPRSKRQKLKYY